MKKKKKRGGVVSKLFLSDKTLQCNITDLLFLGHENITNIIKKINNLSYKSRRMIRIPGLFLNCCVYHLVHTENMMWLRDCSSYTLKFKFEIRLQRCSR